MYKRVFKRAIDVCVAGGALAVLALPLGLITLWLHFANKGAGAFFTQLRPGKDCRIFKIYKYKTMTDERDFDGNLLPDECRLTKVGRFVRGASIDELPQLWNVLKGDMSLIGPRPLVPIYLPYFSEREQLRHTVRPGITGLAQVNGRNTISWDEKLEYDAQYAESVSFVNDMKILFKTVHNVLNKEGVEALNTEVDLHELRKDWVKH